MDEIIKLMAEKGVKADGDLNYILFKFCLNHIPCGYNSFKNYLGELRQAATEIERRLLATYEDKKIIENGDINN